MSKIHDPRDTLTHEIVEGQVYGDSRHKEENGDGNVTYTEQLRLVYLDDERVVLRSNKTLDRGDQAGRHHYRCEHRDVFEKNAAEGRYQLIEESANAPRMPTDGVASALTVLKRLQDEEKHQVQCGAGRKAKHRHEAFSEAVEAVANLDPTPIDWATVDGVGDKAAENLNEAGYETDVDVQSATDEELLDVGLIGQKNLENIKEVAGA